MSAVAQAYSRGHACQSQSPFASLQLHHSRHWNAGVNAVQLRTRAFQAARRPQRACAPAHKRHATRRFVCQSQPAPELLDSVPDGAVSLVLLAGGVGKRMGAPIPKQYLAILGQPIATYSLQTFASMREIGEIVVVCEEDYRQLFEDAMDSLPGGDRKPLSFAQPGKERQDSVFNGFQAISEHAALVAIHDSARPLVTAEDTSRCLLDALQVGAAVLGVAVKPTIKEVDGSGAVVRTLQRSRLVEVQTPQVRQGSESGDACVELLRTSAQTQGSLLHKVIRPDLLTAGFKLVQEQSLEVTDDVSIIEALGKPVKITYGSYSNIKVTTPDDMSVAEGFLKEHRAGAVVHA